MMMTASCTLIISAEQHERLLAADIVSHRNKIYLCSVSHFRTVSGEKTRVVSAQGNATRVVRSMALDKKTAPLGGACCTARDCVFPAMRPGSDGQKVGASWR